MYIKRNEDNGLGVESSSNWPTLSNRIGLLAGKALLLEASAAPKPGLVDRWNSGCHQDMSFYTLVDSALCLGPYFGLMAQFGANSIPYSETWLFARLRPIGEIAQEMMFKTTNGVNTHKGAIFALGLICGAVGRWLEQEKLKQDSSAKAGASSGFIGLSEGVCRLVKIMTCDLCHKELIQRLSVPSEDLPKSLSHGEDAYIRFGALGARGQAQAGYQRVIDHYLPFLVKLESAGVSQDEAYVRTLLTICAETEDTNILHREGLKKAQDAKRLCQQLAGNYSLEAALKLDEDFTRNNISPGGCADLLAVTILLRLLEKEFERR